MHYLKQQPLLNERCIELLQFEAYDEEKQVWQIRIRSSIEGFCPCKHDVSSNDHRASICISPKMVWMRCFRNDGSSDCNARALRWWLPIEEAKEFFPGYHDDFCLLYGVKANEPFRCSTTWICNRFLYSNRDRYIYCNKRLYEKDEFGMYRLCQHALQSVVFSHLKQLRESCEMNKIRYSKSEKGSEEHGLLKESNKLLGKIDNEAVAIVNHIRANLTDHLFLDKVDSDTSLLPFDNGVLDLNHVDRGVRKATVNEYVMKKCRYSFVKASTEEISVLKSKLLPLFASQEEMDFRLMYAAKCLIRSNTEEIILFEFGRSDILRYVEEAVFGDYLASLSPDAFIARTREARREKSIDIHSAKTVGCGYAITWKWIVTTAWIARN